MEIQANPLLQETKYILHKWLSLTAGIIILIFCLLNIWLQQKASLALLEGVLGTLNLYLFWKAYQQNINPIHHHVLIFSISITVLYAFYSLCMANNLIICWFIILPPIYCILGGKRAGFFYTTILVIPVVIILFSVLETEKSHDYRPFMNFIISYFLVYFIFRFYSDQYAKNSLKLHQMAFKDSLTGTENRHALKVFFDSFNEKGTNNVTDDCIPHLVVVDIDHFKSINDEFGHDIGDRVLIETAALLKKLTHDEHIYRIGGEEFLIILHQKACEESLNFAETVRQKIESHTFFIQEHTIQLTVSIGVAKLNVGKTYKDFLREADQNLYSAKTTGRNRVYHSTD